MTNISRRDFLKVGTLFATSASALLLNSPAQAAVSEPDPNEYIGMLYDATICTGCNACTSACRAWNNTAPELDPSGLYDAPMELSAHTWTLIQLYQENSDGSGLHSFIKRQCMHCVDPACVSGCPVHALQKTSTGPVTYDPDRCIGCRYCMYACPFDIPRFSWDDVIPVIAKCTLCSDRLATGSGTACAEICPTGALIWGKRGNLLEIARGRLADSPQRYHNHIYGETDAGGTSVLYLAAVPFEKLGLPDLGPEPVPLLSERTGEIFLPAILLAGPLVLAGIHSIAKREGWG